MNFIPDAKQKPVEGSLSTSVEYSLMTTLNATKEFQLSQSRLTIELKLRRRLTLHEVINHLSPDLVTHDFLELEIGKN
jgi:hypothetical protein